MTSDSQKEYTIWTGFPRCAGQSHFLVLCLLFSTLISACSSKDIRNEAAVTAEKTETQAVAEVVPEVPQREAEVFNGKIGSLKSEPPRLKKKEKKKPGRFQFSGDEFVKEKGNNPFEKKNDTIIRLRGHAKVGSRNVKMASPQIEIYGDDGHMAYAKGPVEIIDTRNATRITADEALFIRSENRAILRGNAKLVTNIKKKKKPTEKVNLSAAELERNFDSSISIARGNVVATGSNAVMYANTAEFHETRDVILSKSEPRIFSGSDLFLADYIQWDTVRNIAEFEGNVKAYFSRADEGEDEPRKKPAKEKRKAVDSAVKAEAGTLVQQDSLPFGQKLTLRRKVTLDRKAFSAYSEVAEVFGPGGELVRAHDNVVLVNREENTKSYGDNFEWVKQSGQMALSAKKNSKTRTLMFNKKNKPTAEISAASLTRATTAAHPQARGNVKIMQFSRNSSAPPVRMGAEWAEMRRAEKVIRLNGSPYVEGELGRIAARDIILYYEEQRYEMLGILPGLVEKRMNEQNPRGQDE